jgi:hypothetical protein
MNTNLVLSYIEEGLFHYYDGIFLVFALIFIGVIGQRVYDEKPVKPVIKRVVVALFTTSIYIAVVKIQLNIKAPMLFVISPLVGFFGDTAVSFLSSNKKSIVDFCVNLISTIITSSTKRSITKDGENNEQQEKK